MFLQKSLGHVIRQYLRVLIVSCYVDPRENRHCWWCIPTTDARRLKGQIIVKLALRKTWTRRCSMLLPQVESHGVAHDDTMEFSSHGVPPLSPALLVHESNQHDVRVPNFSIIGAIRYPPRLTRRLPVNMTGNLPIIVSQGSKYLVRRRA